MMRFIVHATWGLWLIVSSLSWADDIHLKDGTRLSGKIIAETEQEIQIEIAKAGGTIFQTETVKKADIDTIVRQTASERADEELDQAYRRLCNHQLDPKSSWPLEYYDQIISTIFDRFLREHPGSRYESDVKSRRATWSEERKKVEAGSAKINGQWLTPEEAAGHLAVMQARALWIRLENLMARREYPAAIEQSKQAILEARNPDLAEAWIQILETHQSQFTELLKQKQDQHNSLKQRQQQAAQPAKTYFPSAGGAKSNAGAISLAAQAVKASEKEIADVRDQLATINTMMAQAQPVAKPKGKLAPEPAPSTPPADTSGETSVLGQIPTLIERYWLWAVIAIAVAVWAARRYTS